MFLLLIIDANYTEIVIMDSSLYDARWSGPITCQLSGQSGAGKTQWMKRFLTFHKQLIKPAFTRKIWCYSEWQKGYDDMTDVEFIKGINPDIVSRENLGENQHVALVIDDLSDVIDERFLAALFSKISHHRGVSCFFLINSIFLTSMKNHRFVSQNTHVLVLFRAPRDYCSVSTLLRQMFGSKSYKYALEAYEDATKQNFGYLVISAKSDTPRKLKLRTAIFPGEPNYVYVIP